MMKRIFMALLLPLVAFVARSETEVVDGVTWTFTITDKGVSVGGGSSKATAIPDTLFGGITIPSKLRNIPVVSIGAYAFFNCRISSIVIPDSVTIIGESAFHGCSNLNTVRIPDNLNCIGHNAFGGCNTLKWLTLGNGIKTIGGMAFQSCTSLSEITIPDSVVSIEEYAFSSCSSLALLKIGNSVTNIGAGAFRLCKELAKVEIPNSVKVIGEGAFGSCAKLSEVNIPMGVECISEATFAQCSMLKAILIPDGVTTIGQTAFSYCSALESVQIPDSVESIGRAAFYGCSKLTFIMIPANVKTIMKEAFEGCDSLSRVLIGGAHDEIESQLRLSGVAEPCEIVSLMPIINPCDGTIFNEALKVSMSNALDGATIHYTIDGSKPTIDSPVFKKFTIVGKTTVKAIGEVDGFVSGVAVATYGKGKVSAPIVLGRGDFRFSNYSISLSCDTDNVSIYYTTDGTVPTAACKKYEGCFVINDTTTIKAIAVGHPDYVDSNVTSVTFTREWEKVECPTIVSKGGDTRFNFSGEEISLECGTADVAIYYTLDDSTPTTASKRYVAPFEIDETTTVKAIAFKDDYAASDVATMTFVREWVAVHAPSISSASGSGTFAFSGEVITLESDMDGARLFYTTDGSNPTPQTGTEYKGPFVINDTTTVKAIAVKDDYADSEVMERTFVREWQNVEKPMVKSFYGEEETTELKGSFLVVRMSCSIAGAEIHYTTDGSMPTADSAIYTKPLKVFGVQTVKAIAVKDDWKDSEVASISLTKIWTVGDSLNVPDMTFVHGGSSDWLTDTEVTSDGVASMRSGLIADNGDTTLTTYVGGSGTIRFYWKASCEKTDAPPYWWDYGAFMVDGNEVAWLDGETEWQAATIAVVGDVGHELTWRYAKDESDKEGDDCIWIDQVLWIPNDDSETTKKGSVAVPLKWLKEHDLIADDDPETVAVKKSGKIDGAGRELTIADEFVVGTNPNDPASQFKVKIEMVDGKPVIGWEPDLNEDGTKELRQYTTLGCEELCGAWKDVESVPDSEKAAFKFFKVTVQMPDEMEVVESSSGSGGGEGEIVVPPVEPPQDGLPNGYSTNDIPCVSCTGSEWYDLGLPPTLTMKTQIKCSFAGVNEHMAIIGALPVSGNDVNDYRLFIANEPFKWFLDYPGSSRIMGGSVKLNTPYEIEFGNCYIKDLHTDKIIVSGSTVKSQCTDDNIRLFRTNYQYQDRYTTGSVYHVRIFDKDNTGDYVMVRNLVPCKSTTHGIGLLDLVEMKFYKSDGTSIAVSD